jgi:hypothetical protein
VRFELEEFPSTGELPDRIEVLAFPIDQRMVVSAMKDGNVNEIFSGRWVRSSESS